MTLGKESECGRAVNEPVVRIGWDLKSSLSGNAAVVADNYLSGGSLIKSQARELEQHSTVRCEAKRLFDRK